MCMPDFLPVHPGRTSPEPEHQDEQMQQIIAELERTRSELFTERSRRSRVEEELSVAREAHTQLRAELARVRRATREDSHASDAATPRSSDSEATIAKLKNQIKKLKRTPGWLGTAENIEHLIRRDMMLSPPPPRDSCRTPHMRCAPHATLYICLRCWSPNMRTSTQVRF
ncbi:uncharacterized protein LOC113498055 isoform X1 [Trichoplusia ni]|uniref:Uncharacterized protein LOC113498055 isoform X1 n=1 Tax=Trichoplusia ni TaxID=7111 RepID=A0A7E5VZP4_TRINI|nr:uncharacterized protein LOC113498055 isoform X1 [Trichoplusia ni]